MIDDAWRLLNSINEWVRFADAKAGGALAGAGVVVGALASAGLSDKFASAATCTVVFGALAGVAGIAAAALAVYALVPTLRVNDQAVSLIYFEHVARQYATDPERHAKDLRKMLTDDKRHFEEVAAQVWANSKVARKKFIASSWALAALALSVLFGGVAALSTLA